MSKSKPTSEAIQAEQAEPERKPRRQLVEPAADPRVLAVPQVLSLILERSEIGMSELSRASTVTRQGLHKLLKAETPNPCMGTVLDICTALDTHPGRMLEQIERGSDARWTSHRCGYPMGSVPLEKAETLTLLAEVVQEQLAERGWSHETSERELGVSRSSIGILAQGRTDPWLATLWRVYDGLGLSLGKFLVEIAKPRTTKHWFSRAVARSRRL